MSMNRRAFLRLTAMGAAGAAIGFSSHGNLDRRLEAAETSLRVDSGADFNAGDMLVVPRTGEAMRVTGVDGKTISLVRGFGGTGTSLIEPADEIRVIGVAA